MTYFNFQRLPDVFNILKIDISNFPILQKNFYILTLKFNIFDWHYILYFLVLASIKLIY
jgi:hypothetical protein